MSPALETTASENATTRPGPRLQSLRGKHVALEAELEAESARPHPDALRIAQLKRAKLALKDEIARLS